MVAGFPISLLDKTQRVLVVDGRRKSTHDLPTPSRQPPFANLRLHEGGSRGLSMANVYRGLGFAWGLQLWLARNYRWFSHIHIHRIAQSRSHRQSSRLRLYTASSTGIPIYSAHRSVGSHTLVSSRCVQGGGALSQEMIKTKKRFFRKGTREIKKFLSE